MILTSNKVKPLHLKSFKLLDKGIKVEEKAVVIHRGRCNNKVYYRLSHDVVT